MSLDVYLEYPIETADKRPVVPLREDGTIKHLTIEEWQARFPDREPLVMIESDTNTVYTANITHNLTVMASEAGLYEVLWRPDENGIEVAEQLIEPLKWGLIELVSKPEYYRQFNPQNGWGTYGLLVKFVSDYWMACMEYPQAKVRTWR